MNKQIILITSAILCFASCINAKKEYQSPPQYDLNHPTVFKMPGELEEISGIAFVPGDYSKISAIEDEDGELFTVALTQPPQVSHINFGKKGDYEDIAIGNGRTIVLRSDGVFFVMPNNATANDETLEFKGLIPDGEYEGLYCDKSKNEFYVLCKNCTADREAMHISGYILSLNDDNTLRLKSALLLPVADLYSRHFIKGNKPFRPSALVKNIQTNEWYILSSVNKLLVITDEQWHLKSAYNLDPAIYTQPEGIAFDNEGNLYISNEAGNSKHGTILKFEMKNR